VRGAGTNVSIGVRRLPRAVPRSCSSIWKRTCEYAASPYYFTTTPWRHMFRNISSSRL
jgi:hypothetical protein